MNLLDEAIIRKNITPKKLNDLFTLHLFDCIDSTNLYLKTNYSQKDVNICSAEMQTNGRGRFSRNWYSPFAKNIYLSYRLNLQKSTKELSSLSLVVGLIVIKTLVEFNIAQDISIKWPNDILWQEKKLAGVLIELPILNHKDITKKPHEIPIIIGIGLNVNSSPKDILENNTINKPWCSIFDITNNYFDRNIIIAKLISNLNKYISIFSMSGFMKFQSLWHEFDYLFSKEIVVEQITARISGKACGVNEFGELILRDSKGKYVTLNSGETSIKDINK